MAIVYILTNESMSDIIMKSKTKEFHRSTKINWVNIPIANFRGQ